MSDIWAPVIAALGSALLTGLIAFGLEWWRSRSADKAALSERRSRAYSALLAQSTVVMSLARDLHSLIEVKSGPREGINVALRLSSPVDFFELTKWSSAALNSLFEAWSEVWAIGSKEAIAEANSLVTRCAEVMGTGVQRGKARPMLLAGLFGQKWTQEQLDEWQKAMQDLAESRRKLGMIARKETGIEVADLFANNDVNDPHDAQPSRPSSPSSDSSTKPIRHS